MSKYRRMTPIKPSRKEWPKKFYQNWPSIIRQHVVLNETFLKKVVEKQFLPNRVSKKTTVKAD